MRQDSSQIDLGTRPKLRDKPSATWSTAMSRSSGSKGVAAPSLRTADAARFASLVLTWGRPGGLQARCKTQHRCDCSHHGFSQPARSPGPE